MIFFCFFFKPNLQKSSGAQKPVQLILLNMSLAVVDELQDGLHLVRVHLPEHQDRVRVRVVDQHLLEVRAGNRL
jgi:hypothetical protein